MSEAVSRTGPAGMAGSVTPEGVGEAHKQQSVVAALHIFLRWSPTSRQDIIDSEKRLLTLVR